MKLKQIFFLALALILMVTTFVPADTAAAAGTYSCHLDGQFPRDWVVMQSRQDFDMKWIVRNTGTANWNGVDLVFLGGAKMQKYGINRFDVKIVKPLGKATFILDMVAPKNPGTYTTYWGLTNGKKVFCRFYLIVRVK